MSFLVTNCFHWIGFHVVNELLEKGYHVDGVDGEASELKEHLAMFLGRNSSFSLKEKKKSYSYDTLIHIGTCEQSDEIKAERIVRVNLGKTERARKANVTTIHVPLLFGEWMPMNERGMYEGDQFIPFDSDYFLSEAIYIKDFTASMLQWLEAVHLPSELKLQSKTTENKDIKLENSIYLRDNRPVKNKLNNVIDHYQRFTYFYE